MQSLRTRLLVLVSGIAMSAGVLSAPASAMSFSTPQPPSAVTSALAANGVKVTWAPSPAANPPITNYIVHAGPDSCPVTVAASATSAVMPIIRGPLSITPVVQAVNAYGLSTSAAGNSVTVPDKATPGFRNVQFLEFSDFHGAIEASGSTIGAAVLATALAADRKTVKSTFTISAGDNIGGAPVISSAFDELPTIEALNLMKLDVSTFGNHEHDRPIPHLRQMIDASQFDWVASNYSTLAPLKGKVNAPTEFVIEERGGVKVGFVGMNTPDVAELVFAGNLSYGRGLSRSLVVSPALARVNQRVLDARAAGAQLVVALVHEGWDANVDGAAVGTLIDLAVALTGADAVFGAGTHQQYASVVEGRPVVQVPNSGQMYSRTVICLDTVAGSPVGSSVDFVTQAALSSVTADSNTAALVAEYRAALGAKLDVVVGTVSGVFPLGGTPIARDGTVFSVTTVDYMVYGGDGYGGVFSPQTAVMRDPYIDAVLDALKRDLANGIVTVVPVADGRITSPRPSSP